MTNSLEQGWRYLESTIDSLKAVDEDSLNSGDIGLLKFALGNLESARKQLGLIPARLFRD